jgi:hypothetical protein
MIMVPKSYTVSWSVIVIVIGTDSPYWLTQNIPVVTGEHDVNPSARIIVNNSNLFILIIFKVNKSKSDLFSLVSLVFGLYTALE